MFRNQLKKVFEKKENTDGSEKQKKKIENLIFFGVILIITILEINFIWNGKEKKENSNNNEISGKQLATQNTTQEVVETASTSNELEIKLKEILQKIKGVGEVEVFINYSESSQTMPMYDENSKTSTTEETDTSGGVRKIEETDTQKSIVYQENDGEKTPIIQKMIEPKIEGAIITAQGATDANIRTSIIQAVEAVTGLATHKIQVFTME